MAQDRFEFSNDIGGGVTRGTVQHDGNTTELDLSVLGGSEGGFNCWIVRRGNVTYLDGGASVEIFIGMDKPGEGNSPEANLGSDLFIV